MRPGHLTITTQRLWFAQEEWKGLIVDAHSRRRTPDGFSRELHSLRRQQLLETEIEIWFQQKSLPTEAPNDPQQPMPGAA